MRADIYVAAEQAHVYHRKSLIRVVPGAGATQRLTRTMGKYRALGLGLTARRIPAEGALVWGVVKGVVPEGPHLEEAKKLAREVARQAQVDFRLILLVPSTAYEMPLEQ